MPIKTYDPYYMIEFELQTKISNLENLARKQGYSYNKSKLKRDMQNASLLSKKDSSESERAKALFNILVELEEQMFGEQKTYLDIDRKKKITKSKIKRKPKKGCGCK